MLDIANSYALENVFSAFAVYCVVIIVVISAYQLATAAFAAWLAYRKGYNFTLWFFLGLFFGVISLLTIGFSPSKETIETNSAPGRSV
jgi:hypothetical protein